MKKDSKVREAEANLKAAYEHFNTWALESDLPEPISDFVFRQLLRLEEVLEAVQKGRTEALELVTEYEHYCSVIPPKHLKYEGWKQIKEALTAYADAVTFLPYRRQQKRRNAR